MSNLESHIQPNIRRISNEAVYGHDFGPVVTENPANYMDLHGALTDIGSTQAKGVADLLMTCVSMVEVVTNKLWLPDYAESHEIKGDESIATSGIAFVVSNCRLAIEKVDESIEAEDLDTEVKRITKLLDPNFVGMIINTKKSPETTVKLHEGYKKRANRLLVISGKQVKK